MRCIVKGMFYADDAIVREQPEILDLFKDAVAQNKVFFEVLNIGATEQKLNVKGLIEENQRLKRQLAELK
ncbi:hypothetical protein [uncultured Maribacter sp.]|uniref:hypothetical protein n=1 Tax=uncultured Maribacter sp. TaxID=431308 RepID=UPI0030DB558F